MDYNSLKIIDFSRGIKSDEVIHNDYSLQNQINRERLSTAGSGVNYGLEIKLDEFEVNISNILGKSYRKGVSLIATIKLPLIYKKNENDIYARVYEAIRKNMIADDYLILNIEYQ